MAKAENKREDLKRRLQEDGIEYLLTQFVDIHGSAKTKMVSVAIGAPSPPIWSLRQSFKALLDSGRRAISSGAKAKTPETKFSPS